MIDKLTYKLNIKRINGYKRAKAKKQALKTLKTILLLIVIVSGCFLTGGNI
jgi:hypothetical protein